ncbi:MAG: matrixin family metalloprotease [Pirellulales bacterium]
MNHGLRYCGCHERMLEQFGRRRGNQLSKWEGKTHLKWWIGDRLPGLSLAELTAAYCQAFANWQAVCGLTFQQTASQADADFFVLTRPIDHEGSVLAEHELPNGDNRPLRGWFDVNERWDDDGNVLPNEIDLVAVACHEFGHGIGLGHIADGNLLAPYYDPDIRKPQESDIAEAQRRYGPPVLVPPDDSDDETPPIISGALTALQTKQARFVLDDGNLAHYHPLYDSLTPSDAVATTFTETTTGDGSITMDSSDHPVTRSTVAWSMVVLPDTQNYTQANATRNALLSSQCDWIVANKASKGIQLMAHVGDITASNSAANWIVAEARINDILVAGNVEYILVTGNHDMDGAALDRPSEQVNSYFTVPTMTGQVVKDANDIRNTYTRKTMPDGTDFLFLCLEWRPEDTTLDWASDILRTFPDDTVIVVTHENLWESDVLGSDGYAIPQRHDQNDTSGPGDDLWAHFVSQHENIHMVLNGHAVFIAGADMDEEASFGEMASGYIHDTNAKGRVVHELLFNSQNNTYNSGLGTGGAWLRLYEFNWDGTVDVTTLETEGQVELAGANNKFSFTLDQTASLPIDISSDLVFHAKFDEASGTPVNSGSGSAVMNVEAGATTTPGVTPLVPGDGSGKAIQFELNGRVELTTPVDVPIGTDFTLSCFVKFTAVGNQAYLCYAESGTDGWGFLNGGDDVVRIMLGGKVVEVTQGSAILTNTTYHVAITKNSFTGECIFYLDGVATVGIPSAADIILYRDSRNLNIDHIGGRGTLVNDADAIIDDLRVYSRILHPAEIDKLKTNPFFIPQSSGLRLGLGLGL